MILFLSLQEGENRNAIDIPEHLFAKIAQGERDAFEELYHLTDSAVYAYALSILKNEQSAKDVMQDTYLKIRSAAHLYRPMGKPMAWIFTIVRNLSLMKLRQQKRSGEVDGETVENMLTFSHIEDHEDRLVLRTVLNLLSEEERQIVVLHAVSGMKHNEIAQMLGLGLSTVLSKYNRALKKLKKHLTEGGYSI